MLKIRKRVASLVVPYFFWNVFWLCYTILKNNYLSNLGISPEITIDSLGKIIQVFFYRGVGANPTFPIAGYMWFMRDLFICAVLTPLYLWIYRRKNALLIVTIIVFMYLSGIWSWPLNIGFILGGYLGYRRISVIDWVIKQKCWVIIMAFLIGDILYYHIYDCTVTCLLMQIVSLLVILKISCYLSTKPVVLNLAAMSTWFYVVHILMLNIGRHIWVKLIPMTDDLNMSLLYVVNATTCVILCICTYYVLHMKPFRFLFAIMTGGRG